MTIKTDCFLACRNAAEATRIVADLSRSTAVGKITLLLPDETDDIDDIPEGCHAMAVGTITGSDAMGAMAGTSEAEYVLLCTKATYITLGEGAVERMVMAAEDSGAAMLYADHMARRAFLISSTLLIPPPTVSGIKTLAAVLLITSSIALRSSKVAVISRKTSSSAPSAS